MVSDNNIITDSHGSVIVYRLKIQISIMFTQCWINAWDVGPALGEHWANDWSKSLLAAVPGPYCVHFIIVSPDLHYLPLVCLNLSEHMGGLKHNWFIFIFTLMLGGGPRVVVSTAAFHARVRGSVPGLGGLKETKCFFPIHVWNSVLWGASVSER